MNILVTGAAGFIGGNLCLRILAEQPENIIIGIDNINDYYDVSIKQWRLDQNTETVLFSSRGTLLIRY